MQFPLTILNLELQTQPPPKSKGRASQIITHQGKSHLTKLDTSLVLACRYQQCLNSLIQNTYKGQLIRILSTVLLTKLMELWTADRSQNQQGRWAHNNQHIWLTLVSHILITECLKHRIRKMKSHIILIRFLPIIGFRSMTIINLSRMMFGHPQITWSGRIQTCPLGNLSNRNLSICLLVAVLPGQILVNLLVAC